jgi:integrase
VNARKTIERVCEAAGVAWKKNALRHSYASYRMTAITNGPRVAAELGHTSPALLYGKYRTVVTPEEAAKYWAIVP